MTALTKIYFGISQLYKMKLKANAVFINSFKPYMKPYEGFSLRSSSFDFAMT